MLDRFFAQPGGHLRTDGSCSDVEVACRRPTRSSLAWTRRTRLPCRCGAAHDRRGGFVRCCARRDVARTRRSRSARKRVFPPPRPWPHVAQRFRREPPPALERCSQQVAAIGTRAWAAPASIDHVSLRLSIHHERRQVRIVDPCRPCPTPEAAGGFQCLARRT
jgi:hypothetical protein